MRHLKNYDYYLMILTVLIFFAIGLVCLYGITYYDYLAVTSGWQQTIRYAQYINDMNSYLYPFLVLLLVSLGLCIPKRLLEQNTLIKFWLPALCITLILTFLSGIETGLGFILAVMAGFQGIVLIFTIRKSKAIRFEKEGYVVRLGSVLLHLGIVILILNFVIFRENPFHITIFWLGTVSVTVGNIFSFYPEKMTSILHAG